MCSLYVSKSKRIMKKFFAAAAFAFLCFSAFAQDASKASFNFYGFIRNYGTYDTHASNAGTEDLYYYMPNDNSDKGTFNFVALTSRLGVDVKGYEVDGYKVGAKVEADFYSKNSTTAILRMRQAYFTLAKDNRSWKIGQAWHPMAADMPDIFSLETGAPFGPFSRTPLVNFDWNYSSKLGITAAAIWQMQYTSTGPEGAVANYMKYSGIPEIYLGVNLKPVDNLLVRVGADFLSIKPYKNIASRSNKLSAFAFAQYSVSDWVIKDKLTWTQDGSHFNMIGGYGVADVFEDGTLKFENTRNLSDWVSILYKGLGNWRPCLFLGYSMVLGTYDSLPDTKLFWGKLNAGTVNNVYRIQPEITYNLGKVALGAEYMLTSVQYGTPDAHKRVAEDLHWVSNHRLQIMAKYTF